MVRRKQFSAYVAADCDPKQTIIDAARAAQGFVSASALGEKLSAKLLIVIEELVSNILRHGANGNDVSLQFTLRIAGHGVFLEIADDAIAFDPVNDFQFKGPVGASEGGAGLELVRTWSSDLTYRRDGRWNRLHLHLS